MPHCSAAAIEASRVQGVDLDVIGLRALGCREVDSSKYVYKYMCNIPSTRRLTVLDAHVPCRSEPESQAACHTGSSLN